MNLIELLDLTIVTPGIDQEKFLTHKKNLESIAKLGQKPGISDNIPIIFDVVSACSKLSEKRPHDDNLASINHGIIDFLTTNEDGLAICENERRQRLTPERRSGIALSQEELVRINKSSLLSSMFASVFIPYNQPIINAMIRACGDLSERQDLIVVMIDQHMISSDPDMSPTFDLMVKAGFPKPSKTQVQELLISSRSSSGQNAAKLALSFLSETGDDSLANFVFNYNYSGSNRLVPKQLEEERKSLISQPIRSVTDFTNRGKWLLSTINQDSLTKRFFSLHTTRGLLDSIEDHASFLQIATENKFIKTFDILIQAGFDPLKRPEGTVNPFALAAQTQGEVPLGAYLDSIRKKFGETKVREVLEADGTALSHSISGRGYVDVASLFERNGANLRINNYENLLLSAERNHAGIFERLLSRASDNEIEIVAQNIDKTLAEKGLETSYIIDCVLLNTLQNQKSEFAQNLKKRISKKESSLTEQDLFKLCEFNGVVALGYFVEYMKKERDYSIQDHVNDSDTSGKKPLYYAINNNAYNSLVVALLGYGADPNSIAPNLDAATLAARNKESGTLKTLLESGRLSPESINSAYLEIKKDKDNTLVTKAFLEGISIDDLAELAPRIKLDLLKSALEKPELEHCLTKFSSVSRGVKISDLMMSTIDESDSQKLEKLFRYLPIKSMLSFESMEESERKHVFEFAKETTPLVPGVRVKTTSGSKLTDLVDEKYVSAALRIFENDQENSQKRSVLKTLSDNGFAGKKFEKKLKDLGITPKDCMDRCAIS